MNSIRRCLILAAFITALPVLADDKPASPAVGNDTPLNPPITGQTTLTGRVDTEIMFTQVDLKVLLHQYEKLRTEYNEIKLQMWLVNAELNLNQESTEAKKALEEKENDKTVTGEQLDAAQKRFMRSKTQEMDKLHNHCEALRKLADETRELARLMEKETSQRMHESAQPKP